MTIPRIADRKKSMESLKRFNELVNFSSDEEAEKYDLIDILPALKDGDSFCKTAMPGRENVPGGIHITMM